MKTLQIGIFGLGTVGSSTVQILTCNRELVERQLGATTQISKICVRDTGKTRTVDTSNSILTSRPEDILLDPKIDIVVEVMGGIEKSKEIIEAAFKNGKHVVSANKDLIALYGKELSELAKQNNCHFFFEAAVAGGIPILRTLQSSLTGNHINKISGIVNGSTNYILTRMEIENLSLESIIEDAKALGYLEADPSADLDGLDAARKCAILASLGFHNLVKSNQVYVSGIRNISLEDIKQANKLGYKIKLLAIAENKKDGIVARVHPVLISQDHPLAGVQYEFNAVYVDGDYLGQTMYYGRGAGGNPTGSAVVGDIIALGRQVLAQTRPDLDYASMGDKAIIDIEDLDFSYYMRLETDLKEDQLADLLSKRDIKIRSIENVNLNEETSDTKKLEKPADKNEFVIITERVREKDFKKSIEELEKTSNSITVIRIEEDI
ncbi:homoserine dehydrogenase [Peptostreptococcus sp. MV1]|uniref:homoserine dehydrogenase n=1 Tax=Peptostreptococcus sp. MV1 TaxID=1219626 RepID=UPI00050EEB42|nr:homoserine dehydrogenase [Peptostreptococcus sp. MV1]KGF13912.1 homoserine dehydrogenase [Peptostreptococcus sp. MV1]